MVRLVRQAVRVGIVCVTHVNLARSFIHHLDEGRSAEGWTLESHRLYIVNSIPSSWVAPSLLILKCLSIRPLSEKLCEVLC